MVGKYCRVAAPSTGNSRRRFKTSNLPTEPISATEKRTATAGTDLWLVKDLSGTVKFKRPVAAQDAAPLAIATIGHVKYLLTWNCSHLANAQILDRLEPIALAAGFKLPRVCTPEELMGTAPYE